MLKLAAVSPRGPRLATGSIAQCAVRSAVVALMTTAHSKSFIEHFSLFVVQAFPRPGQVVISRSLCVESSSASFPSRFIIYCATKGHPIPYLQSPQTSVDRCEVWQWESDPSIIPHTVEELACLLMAPSLSV